MSPQTNDGPHHGRTGIGRVRVRGRSLGLRPGFGPRGHEQEALDDVGDVVEAEDIVGVRRRRKELVFNGFVDVSDAIH